MRYVFDPKAGVIVSADEFYGRQPPPARSHLSARMIRSDTMTPIKSMLDGRMYDSNSRYERHVKDHGCIVAGNDPSITDPSRWRPSRQNRTSAKETVAQAMTKLGA